MRVLISGAGIAGPTLAWFLARLDYQVTIVEKSNDFLAQGQNIDLGGAAITVVKKMGLLDRIREFNTTEKGTTIIHEDGRPIADFPLGDARDLPSPTSPYEILRGDLATVLADATKDHPNVKYVFGTTIKNVISNDEHMVKVELSNGEVHEFDFAVAADGQWSSLRKMCFPPEVTTVLDKNLYCTYYSVPRLPCDTDQWNLSWVLKARIISLRPDSHGTSRVTLLKMPQTDAQKKEWQAVSRGNDRKLQKELLRSEFADVGGQTPRFLAALDDAPDFYIHAIQQIRMSTWSKSRVICLGDAAYAPTPMTGFGTPLAIIGAYMLAGELSKLAHGENPAHAFTAYEAAFRPFVEKVQKLPPGVPRILCPTTSWHRWILQTMVWIMAKAVSQPWIAKRFSSGDPEADNDGFPLPPYPTLDSKLSI